MKSSMQAALKHIKEFEGGYVDDPHDPGGCTNMGITIATYRRHVMSRGTCADLKTLDWAEAEAVYRPVYWDGVRGDDLPAGVDLVVFDHAVNAGVLRASKILQQVVGAEPDGMVGPITLARVDRWKPADLVSVYTKARLGFYEQLRGFRRYGRGWTRRAKAAQQIAVRMAR